MYNLVAHDPYHDVNLQDDTSRWAKKHAYYKPNDYGIRRSKHIQNNHFLFTFVRNPYDRVLSAYLDKITQPHKQRKIAEHLQKPLDSNITFEDFIKYLNRGGLYGNIHWAPQSSFLLPKEYYGFIGYVETLNQDLQYLLSHIFPNVSSYNFEKETKNITHAHNKREIYYSAELMRQVRRLYWMDFEHLGYD